MSAFTEKGQEKPAPDSAPPTNHMRQWGRTQWLSVGYAIVVCHCFEIELALQSKTVRTLPCTLRRKPTLHPTWVRLGWNGMSAKTAECTVHTLVLFYWDAFYCIFCACHVSTDKHFKAEDSLYLLLISRQSDWIPTLVSDDIHHLIYCLKLPCEEGVIILYCGNIDVT